MTSTPRSVHFVLISCGLLLALAGTSRAAEDKLELRLRLKKGDTYRLRLTVEQHIEQGAGTTTGGGAGAGGGNAAGANPAPTPPQSLDQSMGVGYTMAVKDVAADGAMTIETTYDAVVFRQKGRAGVIEYDSTNPPKQLNPAARAFSVLPGLSFSMTLTPAGGVTAVEGLNEMLAEVVRRLSLPEGPERANLQKVLTEQFGEAAMKQNMQNLFALYPPAAVAVGESWQRKMVVNKGFPLVIDGTYTLKGRAGGVASIELKANLSPNDAAGPVELGTGKMGYELSGEEVGTAKVEEATGWTQSLETTQDLSGSIRFHTGANAETTVPITVKSKVTMEPGK
jgi:hypothetical protein